MSGTFPTEPSPAAVDLSGDSAVTVSTSSSGKRQARKSAGHLWMAALSWSIMPRAALAPIFAFANAQDGSFDSFQIVLPNYATPLGTGAGSPVSGSAAAGASSVSSSGWTGVGDYLKAGDILKFANHSKVYMCTADVNSGSLTVEFKPALIASVSGTSIIVNNVPFTMSLDDDVLDWKGSAPNLAKISMKMKESL